MQCTGTVEKRGGAVNENLATGEIEVIRGRIFVFFLNQRHRRSTIEENCKTKEEIRLKYRYLDLKKTGSSEKYDDEKQGCNC